MLAGDVNQKERGIDTMALSKMLIRNRYRRNQLAASTKDLKRTLCVSPPTRSMTAFASRTSSSKLSFEVNDCVCAELAYKGDIIRGCGRDGSQTGAKGQVIMEE